MKVYVTQILTGDIINVHGTNMEVYKIDDKGDGRVNLTVGNGRPETGTFLRTFRNSTIDRVMTREEHRSKLQERKNEYARRRAEIAQWRTTLQSMRGSSH